MRVQVDGHIQLVFERGHKTVSVVRQEQVRHILYAEDVGAHRFELPAELDVILVVVHGTGGVRHRGLYRAARLFGRLDGGLEVARVVQRIKNTQDVDTVFHGKLAELAHDVVAVMTISEKVLSAQQHLKLGIGDGLTQRAQSVPRVLAQETYAGVERSAAPRLECVIPYLIQFIRNGKHLVQAHTGSRLGLMRVAEDGLHYLNRSFCHFVSLLMRRTWL